MSALTNEAHASIATDIPGDSERPENRRSIIYLVTTVTACRARKILQQNQVYSSSNSGYIFGLICGPPPSNRYTYHLHY